ncbi:MAG TPA: hypothetical protein VMH83_04070 [Candidatus Acidoferrum sp.]|nr:hypothetical protein [Candidatus Acidoferrum sp.]
MSDANTGGSSGKQGFFRADRINDVRALSFYGLGVLIGLILGGIGLFNARGTTTNRVPEEDMALVNQRPILRSDWIAQLENETGMKLAETSREDQLRVLDEMIREELFVQRGLELDFAETDQETRNALYNIVEQQVTASVNFGKAKDEELKAYFDQHSADYTRQDGQPHTFDEVKDDVKTAYFHSEKNRVMNNMMNFLRSRSTILIGDDFKQDYKPQEIKDVL